MADIKGIELASDIYGLEDETARDNSETNTSAIGTLANLQTTVKTDLVSAINEVVPEVQSRPIIKITTRKSTPSNISDLTAEDLQAAGVASLVGSYLVTVHRNTSGSISYFIGWISADTVSVDDCDFSKLAGRGESLQLFNDGLRYSGGDSATITTWVFEPIGDYYTDN